jgi:Right handed beta helix region
VFESPRYARVADGEVVSTEGANMLGKRRSLCAALVSVAALALVPFATATPVGASGSMVHVATTGTDSPTCGSFAAPCRTINQGVTNATAGSIVRVANGTYAEMVTVSKQLTLSGNHAAIDATSQINGILIKGTAASGSMVKGFTVENAIGEGILASQVDNVVIVHNTVVNNDQGALGTPNTYPECQPAGQIPGDCGEGIHLQTTTHSKVQANDVEHNVGGILVSDDLGPTFGNVITENNASNNAQDCGITLPSHTPGAGVHDNVVRDNTVNNNGGAGVLIAASAPGTLAYNNLITDNSISGNGLPGVTIHAHAPGQNVDGNRIVNNIIGTNNLLGDTDSNDSKTTGIVVFSAVVPVNGTIIQDNTISHDHYGLFLAGTVSQAKIRDNEYIGVAVPIHS